MVTAELQSAASVSSAQADKRRFQRSHGNCVISVKRDRGKTVLQDLYQEGASKVLFPRCDGIECFEAILVNTSGGMAGGDIFSSTFQAGSNTNTVLTSQACEKNYRSLGEPTREQS